MGDEWNVEDSDDEDIMNDLFLPEDEQDDDGFDPKELKEMKDALAEKDKQINGLLSTVKTDRRKRQDMKSQFESMKETVNTILTRREQAEDSLSNVRSDEDIIDVEITDDGDAFIPKNKLDDIVSPMQERINELEDRLQLTTQQTEAARKADELIRQMVGEDERFTPAYNKYQSARKWVNDKVVDFQQDNNIPGEISSGDVLSHVVDESMTNEFNQLFPGLDLGTVTTAEDSTWHFKQMLTKTAEATVPKASPDARFRTVMNKPSGLGKSTNAKAGETSLSDRVGSLSTVDIMGLSDEQVEALSKAIQSEEHKEGVTF